MLFFYFYLISFSLLGYGFLISKILNIKLYNIGNLGFLGISFLTIISYASSILIPELFKENDYRTSVIHLGWIIIGIAIMISLIPLH